MKNITFRFDDGAHQRLLDLKEKGGFPTNGEVVRNALRIYEWLQEHEGGHLTLVDGETSIGPLQIRDILRA